MHHIRVTLVLHCSQKWSQLRTILRRHLRPSIVAVAFVSIGLNSKTIVPLIGNE
jgi:hypothetical protein